MSKYNFNIDNDDLRISKSTYNSISQAAMIEIHNNFVDLNLPSGTIWCKYNLGSSILLSKDKNDGYKTIDLGLPSGKIWQTHNVDKNPDLHKKYIGDYYQWGQPEIPDMYNSSGYKFVKDRLITKYCTSPSYSSYGEVDYQVILLSEDDVAYKNMHISNFKFHIPTKEQFEELLEYTTYKWIENYQGINRLDGILFTGKNGNELFFPASGYQSGKSDKIHYNKNNQGHYWSSNLVVNNPYDAWAFNVIHDHAYDRHYIYSYRRALGFTIRPTSNLK